MDGKDRCGRQAAREQATRGHGLLENILAVQRARQADRHIPPALRRGRILDIGCGTSPFFLSRTEFAGKYGLDKVAGVRRPGGGPGKGIALVNHDIERNGVLPFEDGYFDVVTMLAVYEHIDEARLVAVIEEVYRILKPGGMHIGTTPAAWTDRLLRMMARARLVSPEEIEEHKEAYTLPRLSDVFRKTSFSRGEVKGGYFELFVNLWVKATKPGA